MRRILITTDAVGGVWSYTGVLARGIASMGTEVFVLCLGPKPTADQTRQLSSVTGVNLVQTDLPLEWTASGPADVGEGSKFIQAFACDNGIDSVHLHSPAFAAFRHHRPTIAVNHSCVGTWWKRVKGGPLPASLAWMADLVSKGLRQADMIVVPSNAFGREVAEAYNLTRPIHAVHNGVGAIEDVSLASLADYALFAGRLWDEAKNVQALSAAIQYSQIPIAVAGPEEGPSGQLVALDGLRALGTLSSAGLKQVLLQRPVFVSPAKYEPFGLAVLEAAQHGCALVLNEIPTFRELWDGAALFLDAERPDQIGAALNALVARPEERVRLGKKARERSARYSATEMCKQTLDLHLKLVREECVA